MEPVVTRSVKTAGATSPAAGVNAPPFWPTVPRVNRTSNAFPAFVMNTTSYAAIECVYLAKCVSIPAVCAGIWDPKGNAAAAAVAETRRDKCNRGGNRSGDLQVAMASEARPKAAADAAAQRHGDL